MLTRNKKFLFVGIIIVICFIFAWAQDPEYKELNIFTGNLDATRSDVGINGQWLRLDTTNDPLTGNLEIQKADPEIKLTDTGDSNNTRIIRSDTDGKMNLYNTVLKIGAAGNCLDFDGSPEYVNMGTAFNPTTNNFSVSAWFKVNNAGRQLIVSNRQVASPFNGFNLFIDNDDKFFVGLSDGTATGYDVGTIDVDDNAWHHVLLVIDRDNDLMHIYTDGGVDVENVNISAQSGSLISTHNMDLAQDRDGAEDFTGKIDEFAFWSRSLTDNDSSDLYLAGAGLYINKDNNFPTSGTSQGLNLEILLHLDESSGATATDSSGNGRNATLINMEDADWVLGKVSSTSSDVEINVIEAKDGGDANEAGVITIGNDVLNQPRIVLEGKTLRFNIVGVEKAQMDNNGTLTIDNKIPAAQQLILKAAPSASENIFECQDSSSNIGFLIEEDFGVVFAGTGSGLPFAEISVRDNATQTTITTAGQANKVQITMFDTNGLSNNMTPDYTNDHIAVVKPGIYLATVSIHVDSIAGVGHEVGMSLYKNNGATEFTNVHSHRDMSGGGGEAGSMSMSGIISVAVNDTIELWGWNETNTQNFIVADVTLSLTQIGGN